MPTRKTLDRFEKGFDKSFETVFEKKIKSLSQEELQRFEKILAEYNAPCPKWVNRTYEECFRIIAPIWKQEFRKDVLHKLDDEKTELDLNFNEYGVLLGSLFAIINKSIEQSKSEEFLKSPVGYLADLELEKHAGILRNLVLQVVGEKDFQKQTDFLAGYSKGESITVDKNGSLRGELQNFKLYFLLCLAWPFILKLESISQLYDAVKGKFYHGPYDSFRKVCLRLGVKLKARGRPKKNGTLSTLVAVPIKKSSSMRESSHAKIR